MKLLNLIFTLSAMLTLSAAEAKADLRCSEAFAPTMTQVTAQEVDVNSMSLKEIAQSEYEVFQRHLQNFSTWPLARKLQFLKNWEILLAGTNRLIPHIRGRLHEPNPVWVTSAIRHSQMSDLLVADIHDVRTFGLVIGYLGKPHATLDKNHFRPYKLDAALVKGLQYLSDKDPGFDEALEMLKSLPQSDEVSFDEGEWFEVLAQRTTEIYRYAADRTENLEQLKRLNEALPLRSGHGLRPNVYVQGPAGRIPLTEDLFDRVKDKFDATEVFGPAPVLPNQLGLWYKFAELNLINAKTSEEFARAIPSLTLNVPYVYRVGYRKIPELLDVMRPLITIHGPRFLETRPSLNQVYRFFKSVVGRPKQKFFKNWRETVELRKLLVTSVGSYYRDTDSIAEAMMSLHLAVSDPTFDKDEHMDLLFMLQTAIPTANQVQFLDSLAAAVPRESKMEMVDELLAFYDGDRALEPKAKAVRRQILASRAASAPAQPPQRSIWDRFRPR